MGSEAVKVIVRCRPMNDREEKLNCEGVIAMDTSIAQVQLRKPNNQQAPPKFFTFDGVYFMKDTTQQIYEDICFPLVEGVLQGFNGTVFAYGQTGCGKSYTMMGVEDPPENKGVIPRAFDHVFDQAAVVEGMKYMVQASYLEIYNEEVRDLLGRDSKKKLDLHEHPERGVYVQGLSHHKVLNVHDLERVMELGSKNRSVGATLMNVDSSRSHSIFTINIEMMEVSEGRLRCGRLNLVDLAGSERQSKTGSTGERLKEATKINLSLSALGNVISALVDGRSTHVPYRDSKLTRLLQSSLGGNTKTLMVACVSPADNNFDETLSTLRYANRAKNIKNKPRINEDPKDALLREYREEIERLKQLLLGRGGIPQELTAHTAPSPPSPSPQHPSAAQLQAFEEEREAIKREYEAKIAELREQFSKEQSDRAGLQEELGKLQKAFDEQLAAAQERHILSSGASHPPADVTTPSAPAPAQLPAEGTTPSALAPSHLPTDVTTPSAPAPSQLLAEGTTRLALAPSQLPADVPSAVAPSQLPAEGTTRLALAPSQLPADVTFPSAVAPSQLPAEGTTRLALAPSQLPADVTTPSALASSKLPADVTFPSAVAPSQLPAEGTTRLALAPSQLPADVTMPSALASSKLPADVTTPSVLAPSQLPAEGTTRLALAPSKLPADVTMPSALAPSKLPADVTTPSVLAPSQLPADVTTPSVLASSQLPADVTTPSAPALAPAPALVTPSQGVLPSHSQSVPGGGRGTVDADREVLRQHEQALQRLEELQKGMIGGERAGDEGLRKQLQQRRQRADERLEALRHASSELEDDGIIERIFNSLTDEVRVKTKLLGRSQAKLKSAEEDNKDLSAEFEMERQDYLDTIRKQERTIRLQEQLLETIVPCLRRDCNYYNLDKVRLECKYDEDRLEWILPKLIVARANLAHVDPGSSRAFSEQRSASTSKLPRHRTGYSEMQVKSPPSVVSNPPPPNHVQASVYDPPESNKYLNHLHRSTESDYFKPKRAKELLAHSAQIKAGGHGAVEQGDGLRRGSSSLQPIVTANAAAVHGVGSRVIGDSSYSRKPGKLQSLSVNPTFPQNFTPITDSHILDKVEKRLSNRKRNNLEPLQDKKKPPL